MPKKVLLSTDIGSDIDDALSLLTMLNSEIDLKGIYTVNGDVKSRAYIAKHMANLSKKDIPVAVGESKSINDTIEPYSNFEDCYIDDSFIDEEVSLGNRNIQYLPLEKVGVISNGVDDLTNKLSNEKYTIFNIAPLTNIAKALQQNPDIIKNIDKLYIMGARFNGELEHNFRYDLDAAKLVPESKIPITLIPANLCQKYKLPVSKLEQLISPVGKYVRKMAFGFLGIKTANKFHEPIKELDGFTLDNILKEVILNEKAKNLDGEETLKLNKKKDRLIVNLNDSYCGALDNEEYFKQYNSLINFLEKNQQYFYYAKTAVYYLKNFLPRDVSIPDVYVPYCFLHPERIKTEICNIKVDYDGKCIKTEGDNHTIVTDIDIEHFKEFINDNLR